MNTNSRPSTHVDDVGDELRDRLINGDPERVAIYCDFWPAALAADVRDDMRADIDVTVDRPRSPRL